jgi:hypothetical protein
LQSPIWYWNLLIQNTWQLTMGNHSCSTSHHGKVRVAVNDIQFVLSSSWHFLRQHWYSESSSTICKFCKHSTACMKRTPTSHQGID